MKPKIKQLGTLTLSLGLITLTSACQKSEPTASPKAPNSSAEASGEASGEAADTAAPAQGEAKAAPSLKVSLAAIPHNAVIPAENAFCVEDGKGKAGLSANKSPEVSWEGAPEGTQSFVLLAVDPDVPSKADDVNKEGKRVWFAYPRWTRDQSSIAYHAGRALFLYELESGKTRKVSTDAGADYRYPHGEATPK